MPERVEPNPERPELVGPERVEPELDTASRFADPDAALRLLVEAHRGRDPGQSAALNARLVLLLANHIGSAGVLQAALARAAVAPVHDASALSSNPSAASRSTRPSRDP